MGRKLLETNLAEILDTPLLIRPEFVHLALQKVLAGNLVPEYDERSDILTKTAGDVAVVRISGVICERGSIWSYLWGISPISLIKRRLATLIEHTDIKKIILSIDSPGGTVDGVQDLADFIYANCSKGGKEILAVVNPYAYSAAYWIASAAKKIYAASETAAAGSIGVIIQHRDYSGLYKDLGITVTEIFSGEYKNAGSPYRPLDKVGREVLEKRVGEVHAIFSGAVRKHRDLTEDQIEAVANGKTFLAKEALEMGLVDKIQSLDDLVLSLIGKSTKLETFDLGKVRTMDLKTKAEKDKEKTQDEEENKPEEDEEEDQDEEEDADSGKSKAQKGELTVKVTLDMVRGTPEVFEAIKTMGALEERTRIKAIEDATMEGFENLAAKAKFDEPMAADAFEVKMLRQIKENGGITLSQVRKDGEAQTKVKGAPSGGHDDKTQVKAWLKKGMENAMARGTTEKRLAPDKM